jgi:selenocysteine-specific elongation factor
MASGSLLPIQSVIVGTAGHIDHGKSSLVRRLTGINPDRLQEEQERGMTIDLGFARYASRGGHMVGIIDVPGHERFIKNMVAGATSVDVVVLVVAADDGVMPQTREHLEILTLLGIERGMIALTKADLVEEELLEFAIEDVRDLIRGTFLDGAEILPCSNETGVGIDTVEAEMNRLIEAVEPRRTDGLFRMPIQRVFSAKGHGTVITGVPLSGSVAPGTEIEVLPGNRKGKIRGVQAYGMARDEARAGHSCALNVGDLDYRALHRGMVAATPGFFREGRLFEVRLQYLPSRNEPLQHREQVRFHVGTTEVMGRVLLMDVAELHPGGTSLAQIELEEDVVVSSGDRFLVRRPSPMVTLGGGQILSFARHHRRRLREHHIAALRRLEEAQADPIELVKFAAETHRFEPFAVHDLAVELSLPDPTVRTLVEQLAGDDALVAVGRGRYLSRAFADEAQKSFLATLKSFHKRHPIKKYIELRSVRSELDLPEELFKRVIEISRQKGDVAEDGGAGMLRLSSHQPKLSAEDQQLLDELRAAFATADLKPPGSAEVAQRLGADGKHVERLLGLLCDEHEIVRVGTLYFHAMAIDRARKELLANARAHGGEVAIPELRDTLASSRKYMIPLLEYFDGTRVTVRRGDQRFLREENA